MTRRAYTEERGEATGVAVALLIVFALLAATLGASVYEFCLRLISGLGAA